MNGRSLRRRVPPFLLVVAALAAPATAQDGAGSGAPPVLFLDVDEAGELVVRAVATDGTPVPLDVRSAPGAPVWSPDGAWLAHVEGPRLLRTSRSGEREVLATAREGAELSGAALDWSPDGSAVAVLEVGASADLVVVDVAAASVRSRHEIPDGRDLPHGAYGMDLQWSPDGSRILVTGDHAHVVDPTSGVVTTIAREPLRAVWVPSGDALYVLRERPTEGSLGDLAGIEQVALEDLASTTLVDGAGVAALGLAGVPLLQVGAAGSPGGWRLALWASRERASTVQLYDVLDGAYPLDEPSRTVTVQGQVISLRWSPDEATLAAIVANGDELQVLAIDPAKGTSRPLARVTPDAQLALIHVVFPNAFVWSH